MGEDITFSNMDSWGGGGGSKMGLTFKQIILMHINRCVQNGSVEWHGGYWQEKQQQSGIERIYVNNSRDVYNNSVKMLRAILIGYFDSKMNEEDKRLNEEYENKFKEFKESEDKKIVKDWNDFRVYWHLRLFEQLIRLAKRLNFFEEESDEAEN